MLYQNRDKVAEPAPKARRPTTCQELSFVQAGALISYAPDRSAVLVGGVQDRPLAQGAKPTELPVEQASKFVLAINQATSKTLGIVIPESVLLRADEVIR